MTDVDPFIAAVVLQPKRISKMTKNFNHYSSTWVFIRDSISVIYFPLTYTLSRHCEYIPLPWPFDHVWQAQFRDAVDRLGPYQQRAATNPTPTDQRLA